MYHPSNAMADLFATPTTGNGLRGSSSSSSSSNGIILNPPSIDNNHMSRLLGRTKEQKSADGTLAVLIIVSALFCFVWSPILIRKCRQNTNAADSEDEIDGDLARFEAEARAVRAALQRMDQESSQREANMSAEFLDNRREFLDNALLTKKVIFKSEASVCNDDISVDVDDCEHNAKDANQKPSSANRKKTPKRQNSNLVVLLKSKTKASGNKEEGDVEEDPPVEPCAICLADYEDGDQICWSHNDKCPHMFHRRCIQEWLLTHEECPCCRQDFLCLWGDGDYEGRTTLMYNNNSNTNTTTVDNNARSPAGNGNTTDNNNSHSLDWATELAAEIHQQILLRNRQSVQLPNPTPTTAGIMPPPPPQDGHNAVISVGDLHLAAGLLLYRHFPWLLQSDYMDDSENNNRASARGTGDGGTGAGAGQIELPINALVRQQQQFPNQLTSAPVVVLDMNSVQQQRRRGSGRGQARTQPYRQRLRSYVMHNRDRLVQEGQEEAERVEEAREPGLPGSEGGSSNAA